MQTQMAGVDLKKAEVLIASLAAARAHANDAQSAEVLSLLEAAFSDLLGEVDFYLLIAGAADRLGILPPRCNVKRSAETVTQYLGEIRTAFRLLRQQDADDSVVQLTQAVLDQLTTLIGPRLTLSRLRNALEKTRDSGCRAPL